MAEIKTVVIVDGQNAIAMYFKRAIAIRCDLCGVERTFQDTPKTLSTWLYERGYRGVEITTEERTFGGVACEFCANYAS